MNCSRCGKDCDSCSYKEEYSCSGCTEITDGYWGGKCEIKECCEGKCLENCGLCSEFPCEILREFSYDPDLGDDGERLLNCKKLSDDKTNKHNTLIRNVLLGVSLGGIAGVIFGEWQGMPVPFIIGGILIGVGIAAMLEINKRN